MRVTNNTIHRDALAQLQASLRQIAAAQSRVTSGLRIQKASDDPTGAAQVMQAGGSLRALDQYRRNIGSAAARAAAEEGVLDRLTGALTRAKELGLSQVANPATAATRNIAKAEVDQLLKFGIQLGNTRFGDGYLFGGKWENVAPFDEARPVPFLNVDASGNPREPTGERQTEIASGQFFSSNHDGKQVFLDTEALEALHELSVALGNDDPPGITAAVNKLDSALTGVQSLVGDIGARSSQLQVTGANLDALDVNLRTFKSDLEEVDFEKAVTELVSRQTAFQAAMLATSKVMGLSLADYLR